MTNKTASPAAGGAVPDDGPKHAATKKMPGHAKRGIDAIAAVAPVVARGLGAAAAEASRRKSSEVAATGMRRHLDLEPSTARPSIAELFAAWQVRVAANVEDDAECSAIEERLMATPVASLCDLAAKIVTVEDAGGEIADGGENGRLLVEEARRIVAAPATSRYQLTEGLRGLVAVELPDGSDAADLELGVALVEVTLHLSRVLKLFEALDVLIEDVTCDLAECLLDEIVERLKAVDNIADAHITAEAQTEHLRREWENRKATAAKRAAEASA